MGIRRLRLEQIVINHNTATAEVEEVDVVEEQDGDTLEKAPTRVG